MERIEYYTDYRKYLHDYYEDRKKRLSIFSYRYFCLKGGIKSPTLYKEVVEGKRNLTSKTIAQFSKGMGLSTTDAEYFLTLVHFNQSKNQEEKQKLLERMRGLRRKIHQHPVPLDMYEYYSCWHYPVLRELACLLPWKEDYSILAQATIPKIRKSEARKAIEFLLEKGFLKRDDKGMFTQANPAITSGAEVVSLGVRLFNETMAQRGKEAIREFPPTIRDIRTVVIGISPKSYALIKEETREYINRIIRIVDDDKESDRVYNLSIQLFPLSTPEIQGAADNESA
jgi:uncharacterized protein (TIGR02147 family)